MPQSIFQGKPPNYLHDVTETVPPQGWIYIGDTVQEHDGAWGKIPVWNRVGNNWIQLNAALDRVDYALVDLKHNRVTLDIHDHLNFDYLDYSLTVTPQPGGWDSDTITLPDDIDTYDIKVLQDETTYTVDLRANLRQGGQTGPSIQTITTPKNPIPLAPALSYSNLKNTSVRLNWTDPVGSTASSWNVYQALGNGTLALKATVTDRTHLFSALRQDTKYRFVVAGVNDEGFEGPRSNEVRIATGHEAKYRRGSVSRFPMNPWEWGSWRPDIGWYDWHQLWYYNRRVLHDYVYQGYWQKDPIWTGSTVGINRPEQESGRYRGIVTYNMPDFRARMERAYGKDVWRNLNVTRTEVRRVYRHLGVGTINPVHMEWRLTYTNVFDAAAGPPLHYIHRNVHNNADSHNAHDTIRPGQYHDYLRLPRSWGRTLAAGGNSAVGSLNGLAMYRPDHINTGAGAAGYARFSGHGKRDPQRSGDSWRISDWRLLISASWNFKYVNYKAPAEW